MTSTSKPRTARMSVTTSMTGFSSLDHAFAIADLLWGLSAWVFGWENYEKER
jgi:hypothetical protein